MTVGTGITPVRSPKGFADYTAGGDFHSAPKKLVHEILCKQRISVSIRVVKSLNGESESRLAISDLIVKSVYYFPFENATIFL